MTAVLVNGALAAYPVGSVYMSVSATSPAELFGGVWERIKDAFLLAVGDSYAKAAGATGGSPNITVDAMPSHSHTEAGSLAAWSYRSDVTSGSKLYDLGTEVASTANGWGGNDRRTTRYSTASAGGSAQGNMPPYLAVYMWKRTA